MSQPVPTAKMSQRRRLSIVLALNLALIAGLLATGLSAHSLSVLAAAGDTLADSLALILGLVAVTMRDRRPDHPTAQLPIAVVALINAAILIAVTVTVAIEAIARLLDGSPAVLGLPMAVVSFVTLVVMVSGALVLGFGSASEDIHMKSVLLDTLADAAIAAGVLVAGLIIFMTRGLYWLDPVVALALGAVIGVAAVRVCLQAVAAIRSAQVRAGRGGDA